MPKPFTHTLIHKKEGDISTSELFRASDGMRIAVRQNQNVFFGENPNTPEIRYFMEQRFAVGFMRKVADADYFGKQTASLNDLSYLVRHYDCSEYAASIDDPKPFDSLIIDPYAGTDLARAN